MLPRPSPLASVKQQNTFNSVACSKRLRFPSRSTTFAATVSFWGALSNIRPSSPFLTYGILSWGNAYTTTLQPLYILQKKAMRIITFSNFDQHSTPLFRLLNIIKLYDLLTLHISVFMFKFHNRLLPSYFDFFFTQVKEIHKYNTRSAANQSYYLPRARTNYGLFNIRFQGPKVWNSFGKDMKSCSLKKFKAIVKDDMLSKY